MFDLKLENGIIVTMEPGCRPFVGSIGVTDGRFAAVCEGALPGEARERVDAAGKIIFPGMVNGHVHGDMTVLRGLGDGLTLLEQNEIYEPRRYFLEDLTKEDLFWSRQLTYIEAIMSGTTFLLEHEYTSLGKDSVRAMAETGIRGGVSDDIQDRLAAGGAKALREDYAAFFSECREQGILPVVSSLSEEFFDEEQLRLIEEFARDSGVLITQHFAETDWRSRHIAEHFRTTPVRYLQERGLLNIVPIIGSHAVQVDREEVGMLGRADFRVVNTPLCEMKIADGVAPIPDYLAAGVPVGLGTDGGLWNNSNDLFREIKGILLLHAITGGVRAVSARQALEMATIQGARVFGLEEELGSIAVGKRADFITIDTDAPHLCPLRLGHYDNVLSTLAYSVTGQDVRDSYIGGRAVMRDRSLCRVDRKRIMEAAREAGERGLARYDPRELLRPED